jgi:hypothetical protein
MLLVSIKTIQTIQRLAGMPTNLALHQNYTNIGWHASKAGTPLQKSCWYTNKN